MKRFSNYLLSAVVLASALFFASCSDDGDGGTSTPGPTITLTPGSFEGIPGDEATFQVDIVAPGGFNVMRATVIVDGAAGSPTEYPRTVAGETTFSQGLSLPLDIDMIGKDVVVSIEAVDDLNQTSTKDFVITVNGIPISTFTAILLAPPTGDETSLTFFSSTEGTTYSVTNVNNTANTSPKIDFGYYYGTVTDFASISSPASYPTGIFDLAGEGWDKYNATLFRDSNMSVADFDAIGDAGGSAVAAEFEVGTDENGLKTQLAVDDIIAFKTDAGDDSKFGLIKVVSIDEGFGVGDGITIEVKVIQ